MNVDLEKGSGAKWPMNLDRPRPRGSGARWPMNVGLDLEGFWREVANERQTAMISRGSGARWPMNVDLEKGSGAKWPMNQEDRLAFAKRALVVWLVGSH